MVEGTCATCRFFMKAEQQHIYGDCHRHPPQFTFQANLYEPNGYGSSTRHRITIDRDRGGVWPNVSQDEWCGEYQAKEPTHD